MPWTANSSDDLAGCDSPPAGCYRNIGKHTLIPHILFTGAPRIASDNTVRWNMSNDDLPKRELPKDLPKELFIDEKWDKFIDITIRRVTYGTLAGGLVGLILMRASGHHCTTAADSENATCAGGATARVASLTFGAGIGMGSAWQQSSKEVQS